MTCSITDFSTSSSPVIANFNISYALFAYRETPHEETGFSPLELLYGWPVRGRTEILKLAMTGEEDVDLS
jgi:hypothetical protein